MSNPTANDIKKNPGVTLWNEIEFGRSYRNEQHKEEASSITPRHSPLNLPFDLSRRFRKIKTQRKSFRCKKLKNMSNQSHKMSVLDRSALCQNDYMNLLSIPNKTNQTEQTTKKTCLKCKVEPCPPRLVQMSIPNKRLVLENWKTYQSTLSPEILVRFDKILKSGDNLELRDARYYFKKLQKQKRKEIRKKKQIRKAKKKTKIKSGKQWIKKEIDNLAQMIADFIENQPLLTLNFQQMITSDKLLEYLNREKVVKIKGRNTKSTYKKTVIEINDKIVNWLDAINYQAEMQPLSSKDKIPTLIDIPSLEGLLREAEETDEESKIWSKDEESDEKKYEKTSTKEESLSGEDEDVQFIAKKIMDHSKTFDKYEPEEDILQVFTDLDEDTLDKLINILSTSPSEFLNQFVDTDSMPGVTYQDVLLKLEEMRENKMFEEPTSLLLEDIIVEWAKNNKPDEIDDKILDKIRETSTILTKVFNKIDKPEIHQKNSNLEEKIDKLSPVYEKSSLNDAPTLMLENETSENNKQNDARQEQTEDKEEQNHNKIENQEIKQDAVKEPENKAEEEKKKEENEKHEKEDEENDKEEEDRKLKKNNEDHKEEKENYEKEDEIDDKEEDEENEEKNVKHDEDNREHEKHEEDDKEHEEENVEHEENIKEYQEDTEENVKHKTDNKDQENENIPFAINVETEKTDNKEDNEVEAQMQENEDKDEKISGEEVEKLSRKDSVTDSFKHVDQDKELISDKNLDKIEEYLKESEMEKNLKESKIERDLKKSEFEENETVKEIEKRKSTIENIKYDSSKDLQALIEKPAKQLSDLLKVIKGHKPLVVFEHSPGTICCLSLKIWAVWLLEISENAHKWTKWVRNIIKVARHYAARMRGEVTFPNEQKKVLYNEEWRTFIKSTEDTMVAWRQYSSHVNDLSVEIIEHFHGKKVNCCPKCLQDHLIKNVPTAHETLQALTEAINCASYWQRCLDKIVNKTMKLAEIDVAASIEKIALSSNEESAIVEIETAYISETVQSDESYESVAEITELSIQKPKQYPQHLIEELRLPKIKSKSFNIVEFNPVLRQQPVTQQIEEECSKKQFKHFCTKRR